jgi:RNA-dependent RNA polymerase
MIWEATCETSRNFKENCVEPSAYQFRFLGYKGVVVVDHRLEGIKMRLRRSQCKFPVNDDDEADFEIARSFDSPTRSHLNRFVFVSSPSLMTYEFVSPSYRPAVMALEDRGVEKQAFIDLQEKAKAQIYHSGDSLEGFSKLLRSHGLGGKYRLGFILEQLINLRLDFKDGINRKAIQNTFFERLLRFSIHHSLREVKFKARIPIPNSYQLVGIADEGRAYIEEGLSEDDVFTLKPDEIYGMSPSRTANMLFLTRIMSTSLCTNIRKRVTGILQGHLCHF